MQIDSPLFKAKSKYLAHHVEQYSKFVILDLSIIGQNPMGWASEVGQFSNISQFFPRLRLEQNICLLELVTIQTYVLDPS